MDIANLIIRVTSDGLNRVRTDLGRLRDEANRTSEANSKLKDGLDSLSQAATIGLGALTGVVVLATKKAVGFESAMAEVNKTVDFATNDGLSNMRKQLEELTKEIPQSFEELAGVAAVAGQLGIAEKDIIGFTETIAKMGVAFDMSSEDAADSMAKIANIFAIPIENIGQLGDTINTLSNSMASTAPGIIDFISRTASLGKMVGLSSEKVAAYGSAMLSLGMTSETSGTAFNALLLKLANLDGMTDNQYLSFVKLGTSVEDFQAIMAKNPEEAINLFLESINKLDQAQKIPVLAEFIGADHAAKIASMATGIDTVNSALASTADTAGSMQKEFDAISGTTANKMQLFKNNIDLAAASLGDAFIPMLNEMLLTMTPVIDKITTWVSANPELMKQIVLVTGSILASIIGLKLFADGVTAAVTTVENLKTAFTLMRTASTIMMGGFGLTVLALGALVVAGVLVYQNWETISNTISENKTLFMVLGGVIGGISAILLIHNAALIASSVAAAASAVTTAVMTAATVTWSAVSAVAATATWAFGAAIAFVTSPIGILVIAIVGLIAIGVALYKNWDTINAYANAKWAAITATIKSSLESAEQAVSNAWNSVKTTTVTAFNNIKTSITTTLKELPSKMLTIGKQIVMGLINGIKSGASGVATAIGSMASSAVAKAKSVLDIRSPSRVMKKVGEQTAEGMAVGIRKGARKVVTEAQRMAENAIEATKNSIASLQKDIALFGNDSLVASFDFDVSVGKYAGVPQSLLDSNRKLIVQKQALIDLDEQQTKSAKALAKSTESIQARFTKLADDREASKKFVDGVMGEIKQESPLDKLQSDYDRRLAVITKNEMLETGVIGSMVAERIAIEKSYQDAKQELMLTQGEALFGNLAGLSKTFLGEQSGLYRALFAVEKGYTLATVLLKNKEAIAKAWSSAPFPYNLGSVATTVAGTAGIASAVAGIMPSGFKQGGYTGNGGSGQVAGVVHGQEYVFDAQSTKRIGVDNLNAMRSGKAVGGGSGDVNINVNVDGNGNSQVSGDNDKMGREMANGIKAVVMDIMRKEKRQGGMLYA